MESNTEDREVCAGRFLSVTSYIGILCLIPFIIRSKNEFVLFHARQGLVLWLWLVLAWIAVFIPVIGQIFWLVTIVLYILFTIGGMIQAALGKCWRLPLVGSWAEEF